MVSGHIHFEEFQCEMRISKRVLSSLPADLQITVNAALRQQQQLQSVTVSSYNIKEDGSDLR